MKKITLYIGLLLSASILLSACQQKAAVAPESSSQGATTAEDPVPTNLAEGTLQEVSTATEAAEMPYTLSDSAKGQLTGILTNAFSSILVMIKNKHFQILHLRTVTLAYFCIQPFSM